MAYYMEEAQENNESRASFIKEISFDFSNRNVTAELRDKIIRYGKKNDAVLANLLSGTFVFLVDKQNRNSKFNEIDAREALKATLDYLSCHPESQRTYLQKYFFAYHKVLRDEIKWCSWYTNEREAINNTLSHMFFEKLIPE